MNRRRFAALVAGSVAATPNVAAAQPIELEECRYLVIVATIYNMMLAETDRFLLDEATTQELGFAMLRTIAIADAGYSVINESAPLPGFATSHRLLLESLETIADADDDIRRWMTDADVAALQRGTDAVQRGLEVAVEARQAMPLGANGSAQDTPARPTRTPVSSCSETPVPAEVTVASTSSGVTLANFNRIREGMSYREVTSILGSSSELISSSELGGIRTEMYMWEGNSLGANMNAMFQDGVLISKAQFGLD